MPAALSERKLTAIVVADVVGYSRLISADEEGTIARLRDMKSTIVNPAVSRHHGRIVKTMGDGFLVEFPSVVDAVRSSLEVQRGLDSCNIENGCTPFRLRVGVHISDVIVEPDGDLLGDGVNIAARLQEIAEAGTVCLSEDAFHQVRNKISVPVVDRGSVELKNIPQPIHVYALQGGQGDAAPAAASASTSSPPLSIVVLPFANLGRAEGDEQFTDGLTETLTTDLARIPHSAVIARNTAFTFKGKAVDARQIGGQLQVRYILEGSVQRSDDCIRVNVQLIDAESGNHLWADRFDKKVGDLLQMQDEIVARVANALKTPLIAAEAQRTERSAEPASLDLYFQGMAWINKGLRPDWLEQARICFEKAKAIDDTNLEALIGIGMVDSLRGERAYKSA
jgi:TolB-like protein